MDAVVPVAPCSIMNQITHVAIRVQATSSTILPQSSGCIKDDLKNQARIQEQHLASLTPCLKFPFPVYKLHICCTFYINGSHT